MTLPTDGAAGTASPHRTVSPPTQRRRIGEVLLSDGAVSAEQLETALVDRVLINGRKERLGQAIVRLGFATDADIARALARQLGMEHVNGDELALDPSVAAVIPSALAERCSVLPLRWEADGVLVVACDDPTDVVAMDDVRLAAGARRVRPAVVASSTLVGALRKSYGFDSRAGELIEALDSEPDTQDLSDADLAEVSAEDAPVVRLAEGILRDAIDAGASDIHVEPGATGTAVRYRVDGVLHTVTTVPRSASGPLLSRLKLMGSMDIAERRRPQDGRMRVRAPGAEVDFRASTLPSMFGETMVMRLLRKGAEQLSVDQVGLTPTQLAGAMSAIERPQGLILITGPTGSGKTSTLYAFLQHLADEAHNIITLEDPIEYQLDGINQTQIQEKIGFTFAKALRTVLRQDPDIVMVGEIRDPETAELALQASLTGHLVFSTLHANDAPGAVVRLSDLGIPSYLISSALTMVAAQRLVRTICPDCKTPSPPTERQMAQLHLSPHDVATGSFSAGAGCNACNQSGYRGRLGLFEVLTVDGRTRELLATGAGEAAIRQAARVSSGMRSLREDGIAKARDGLTTLDEVLRVTPTDAVDRGTCPGCAQALEPDFDHCPWCGADLRPDSCARCERELRIGWQACPSCGTPTGTGDAAPGGPPRVLVVDDDPSVRAAVSAMLHGDYEVVACEDGQQALDRVGAAQPRAVLLDLSMPGLDGYEVTRQLRARQVTTNLPIILMTGHDERTRELEGLQAGADDFLAKPLDPDVLLARLGALLRRSVA